MKKIPETDREWLEHWDKKRWYAEEAYDSFNGDMKYAFKAFKYECVCDAFRAKIRLAEILQQQREEKERYLEKGEYDDILRGLITQDTINWLAGIYGEGKVDVKPWVRIDRRDPLPFEHPYAWGVMDYRLPAWITNDDDSTSINIIAHGFVDKTGVHHMTLTDTDGRPIDTAKA